MTCNDKPAVFLFALGLAFGLSAAAAPGVTPAGAVRLVHDFFPGEFQGGRTAPQLTQAGNALFFVAADFPTGRDVWRTDGTAAGTARVAVPEGPESLGPPRILGAVGGRALWTAWKTADPGVAVLLAAGESGGATLLYAGALAGTPRVLGQRLFFVACPAAGCAVWSTDGTAAGTGPVPALTSRHVTGAIFNTLGDQWLLFRSGSTLLAYDATRGRTFPILSSPFAMELFPTGETLFVVTLGQETGIWASRLSSPGATLVFTGSKLALAGWREGRLYFATKEGRLWSTDGRPEGTLPYSGLRVDAFSLLANQLGGVGSRTLIPMPGYYGAGLLSADDGTHEVAGVLRACAGKYSCLGNRMSAVTSTGDRAFEAVNRRLVQSDGTPEGSGYGTGLVAPDAGTFAVRDGRLLLGAVRQGVGQLWETDGTAAGTRALTDGTRDRPFRVDGPPISYNGALFMAAKRKPVGQQLWRVEGGRATALTDLRHLATGIEPNEAFPVGDRTLLAGNEVYGWLGAGADGTVEPVANFVDVCTEVFSDPCTAPPVPVGKRLVFANGDQLWSTDGTDAGTVPVADPEGNTLTVAALGRLGDRALILTQSGELWSGEGAGGASGGMVRIAQLPINPSHPERFAPVLPPVPFGSSSFVFRRAPGPTGPRTSVLEIWRTDGTAAGTLLLASTPFPDDYSSALSPAVVGGRLFFRFGGTLWMSDGSPAGTLALPQQLPGGTFALAAGATTLFAAAGYQDGDPNHETLWAIDPSTLAASALGTFGQVSSGGTGADLGTVLGDTLWFGVTDPQDPQGIETVWLTEGTAVSTRKLPDPLSGLTAAAFHVAGDRRYFTACEPDHGCELWSTGRLGEDSALVADLWPGARGSDPEILAAGGASILFAATEPTTGRELWKLDLTALKASGTAQAPALSKPPRPLTDPAGSKFTESCCHSVL